MFVTQQNILLIYLSEELTMLAEEYFNNILWGLNQLLCEISIGVRQNLTSTCVHAEGFFCDFLNVLYEWNLENINDEKKNNAGYDLIDKKNRIIVQVSRTFSHSHIQASLDKSACNLDKSCIFIYLALTDKRPNYKKEFYVPAIIAFNWKTDILDIDRIMNSVLHSNITIKKALSELVDQHFKKAS